VEIKAALVELLSLCEDSLCVTAADISDLARQWGDHNDSQL